MGGWTADPKADRESVRGEGKIPCLLRAKVTEEKNKASCRFASVRNFLRELSLRNIKQEAQYCWEGGSGVLHERVKCGQKTARSGNTDRVLRRSVSRAWRNNSHESSLAFV